MNSLKSQTLFNKISSSLWELRYRFFGLYRSVPHSYTESALNRCLRRKGVKATMQEIQIILYLAQWYQERLGYIPMSFIENAAQQISERRKEEAGIRQSQRSVLI